MGSLFWWNFWIVVTAAAVAAAVTTVTMWVRRRLRYLRSQPQSGSIRP